MSNPDLHSQTLQASHSPNNPTELIKYLNKAFDNHFFTDTAQNARAFFMLPHIDPRVGPSMSCKKAFSTIRNLTPKRYLY